jgi:hypothetical protein
MKAEVKITVGPEKKKNTYEYSLSFYMVNNRLEKRFYKDLILVGRVVPPNGGGMTSSVLTIFKDDGSVICSGKMKDFGAAFFKEYTLTEMRSTIYRYRKVYKDDYES